MEGIAWSVRYFPGVRESLEALRGAGWNLGVAANGAGDIQRAKLAATGLTSPFDGILRLRGDRRPETGVRPLRGRRLTVRHPAEHGWVDGGGRL
ncbi:hypothetical protein ABZV67_01995 [Streptomyces sp. NPDC005065]|uniref:HAD family hydrolase n=1 Tax=unclassified Streptomyces TaxID=2593676 RepID=UPI0033BB96AE